MMGRRARTMESSLEGKKGRDNMLPERDIDRNAKSYVRRGRETQSKGSLKRGGG